MSNTVPVSPYPTQAEILREIAKALGVKGGNKKLDDYVRTGDVHYQLRDEIIQDTILRPIKPIVSVDLFNAIEMSIINFLDIYIQLVISTSLEGIPRSVSLPLLIEHFFSKVFSITLEMLIEVIGSAPLCASLVDSKKSAIETLFLWLDNNHSNWNFGYSKEEKDKFTNWRKGKNLPQFSSIASLNLGKAINGIFLIARFIDYFRTTRLGCIAISHIQNHLKSEQLSTNCKDYLTQFQIDYTEEHYKNFYHEVFEIINILGSEGKNAKTQKQLEDKIENLKLLQCQLDTENLLIFYVFWCEAWFYVLEGNLKKASRIYEKAVQQSLFLAGENQLKVLQQALTVAAKIPNRAFCKKLKNQGIVFKLFDDPYKKDHLDIKTSNKKSRSRSHDVEDWEVKSWNRHFHKYFPANILFPQIFYKSDDDSGAVYIDIHKDYKPNYRIPNRRVKTGKRKKGKIYPQLVWFTVLDIHPNYDAPKIIKRLLKEGASVDLYSNAGETPILQALMNMNIFDWEYQDPPTDDTCFNIISSYPHKQDTLNCRSVKKKLLPLTCAVNTGRPKVVKKLLDMGAKIDRKGGVDMVSALYQSLIVIAFKTHSSEEIKRNIRYAFNNLTPGALEAARRYSGGMQGITLEHHQRFKAENPQLFDYFLEIIMHMSLNKQHFIDLNKMYEIADILLEHGANPNEEVHGPIKGYTPLMLAAELDEADLFKKMLDHGGDPDKIHHDSHSGKPLNCRKIVERWESTKVAGILDKM